MKRWRSNGESVSPVIATILMVAITVVLAAVLYVLVSGFFNIKEPPVAMGVQITRENSGNYSVKVISGPAGLVESRVLLTVSRSSAILVGKVALTSLTCSGHGAVWVQPDPTSKNVGPGDFIVLSGAGTDCPGAPGNTFAVGDEVTLSDANQGLWSGKIN